MSHAHLHDKIAREILTSGEGGDFDLSNYDAESCETLVKEVREKNVSQPHLDGAKRCTSVLAAHSRPIHAATAMVFRPLTRAFPRVSSAVEAVS
jgi:hypothetical protein